MKKILFFLVLATWVSLVFAGTIQNGEAKIIALNWINSRGSKYFEMSDIKSVYSKVENEIPVFYIISFAPSGWVIVSGSDIVEPVLGYSIESQFDLNQIPPQFEGWMGGISKEIETAVKNKMVPSPEIKQKWQKYRGKIVEKQNLKSDQSAQSGPLLTSTWGQGKFYNEMAPADPLSSTGNGHVWLGCVATAMVQIMKYWEYPVSGLGSHSYSHAQYGTLSANFGNSTYNWAMMPDNVTSLNNEVQKIGYHCAVSVDMDFGPYSSGAWLSDANSAYINYFKYNSTVFESEKANWNDTEWKAQLRREIDAGRPILYSGYNSSRTSGHAWVCDGYSSSDFFHFNWGWNGSSNGDFLLSSLTPGTSNYSTDQAALFSIEPVTPATIRFPYTEDFESLAPNEIRLMGVNEITSEQTHTGSGSLKLGKESIFATTINVASLCFLVPEDAELNFWVKRYTPVVSANNQQKAFIMPQYGSTPIREIYNGDYNDSDWVSYNVDLSAYTGQIVRLILQQELNDYSKPQWMFIDDISITGLNNNLPPFIPSNPVPSNLANYVTLTPTLHWSCGDPNGDDLIYKVYLGTTTSPPMVGSVFGNYYTPPAALQHTTTYYWKIVADDDSLTTEGPLWTFTTKGIPPSMGNCGFSNLTSNSLTVCGQVLDYNSSTVSSRGICWSQNQNPVLFSANYIEVVNPTDVFSCNISGLLPYTKYYYRSFAISNQGNAYSQVLNIQTLPELPVVSIVQVENILRSSAIVKCKINSINDSSVICRGIVWSTVPGFNPSFCHIVSEEGKWSDTCSFTINLTNLPGPGNIYYKVFAVNSVGVAYSGESIISTINVAPTIDLDANNSSYAEGIGFNGSCFEQKPGGAICDSDVDISDHDGDTIRKVTVQLTNAYKSGSEYLNVLSENENLIVDGNGTGQLVITSTRSLTYNEWEDVLRSIEYWNNLDAPHEERIRQIQVQISDGFDLSQIATANIKITQVNDPPVNQTLPSLDDTIPVFGSRVRVLRGTWADILDSCNGIFDYSYSWQMKKSDGEIIDLDFGDQQILPIVEDLCGSLIRVVEMVDDNLCGGTNREIGQAESNWYLVGRANQTMTLDPISDHNFNEAFFTVSGRASSGMPLIFSLLSQNNVITISRDTAYILNAGKEVISGIQPGNECYLPSNSWNKNVTIVKGDQSIEYEQTIEAKYHERWMKIPASATSGLGLVVTSSNNSVANVINDTIYFSGIGKAILSISQPGNVNYFPAKTVEMNLSVFKGDQFITSQYPEDLVYGKENFIFNVFSSAQLGVELTSSDPFVLEISGDSLIVNGVGEVILTASQPGNNLWNPAADVVDTLIVKKGTQEIYVEPISDKVFLDPSFVPVYHSSTGLDVSFSVRDTSVANVVDGEVAIKNVGETVIDFNQAGNEFWQPASKEIPFRVAKANQVIAFNDIEDQLFGTEYILLSAISSSGLGIDFEISNNETGSISGDTLFIHNAGNTKITASQPGNDQFNPATPVSISLTVEKATQSIVSHLPDSLFFDHQVIFADVESTSGLSVDIFSSDDGIVKVVSDSLHVNGPGEVVLTLTQPGDGNYLPAESSFTIVVSERVGFVTLGSMHFSMFPNPMDGKASLIVKGNSSFPLQVSIVNSTGKTISNFEIKNPVSCIDLSNQPLGLYFVIVRFQNGNLAQKLLITR
jgi:uncharacterized protein YaiE (UPF0345 family)